VVIVGKRAASSSLPDTPRTALPSTLGSSAGSARETGLSVLNKSDHFWNRCYPEQTDFIRIAKVSDYYC